MVQGLGFLSKKSWHTKNIANQEKVWMAEEREKAEKAKTEELAKQIQQEREEEDLRRVTGTGKSLDRGIAWLYDGHKKDSETAKEDAAKQAEEYLLGKPITAEMGKTAGDFDTADTHEGVNAIVETVAQEAHLEQDSVAHRNEAFRIRHEDPMYAVSLQSVRQEKAVEHRKDLYERAGIQVATVKSKNRDQEESRRKHKKKEKKRKTSEKKRRKRRSDSADDSYDSRRHRKRRYRSRSIESDRRRRSRSYNSRDEPRRRRRRSRSPSDPRQHRQRCRSRSPEYPDDRYRQHHFQEERRHFDMDEFGRALKPNRNTIKHDAPKRVEGYGLQGGSHRPIRPQDLGPDPDLLQAKRKTQEAERQERMERTSSRRYKSSAEREKARLEMEKDAQIRSVGALKRPTPDDEAHERPRSSAEFLREATVKGHGLDDDKRNLSDRLRENRHKSQKLTDSFL